MSIQAIELPDRDGLRHVRSGRTASGNYPYVCQANPLLAAEAVARKHLRAAVKEQNLRRWS